MPINLIRSSERSTFKRCVQRWWWAYREGLVAKKPDRGARAFGTGIHLALAEYYIPGLKRGPDPRETWEKWSKDSWDFIVTVEVVNEELERVWYEEKELGIHMLTHYLDTYQGDPHWDIIQAEQRFKCLIPHPQNPKKAIAKHVGTFDAVVRDLNDGHIKLIDHKSTNIIANSLTAALCMDDQGNSYISLGTHALREAGVIGKKEFIRGLEYNFLRKAVKDTRPKNEDGRYCNKPIKKHYIEAITKHLIDNGTYPMSENLEKLTLVKLAEHADILGLTVLGDVSKMQPPPYFLRHLEQRNTAERNRAIRDIGNEMLVMNEFRYGRLPILKTRQRDCAYCDFFDMCQQDDAGADAERTKELQFRQKDPYFDHRKGADNSKQSVLNDRRLRREFSGT